MQHEVQKAPAASGSTSDPDANLGPMEIRAAGGNISEELKEEMTELVGIVMKGERFARQTLHRMRAKELWVTVRPEDGKRQARTVFEIVVDRDMTNPAQTAHGACLTFLVDDCTSMTLALLALAAGSDSTSSFQVSQGLNIVFHAPATVGAKLNVISTSLSMGSRALTATCEIWDISKRRLCLTATHTKMVPSEAKL